MRLCIVSGDAVGGLRKHVHDILAASPSGVKLFYIHSNVVDIVAQQDFVDFIVTGIERLPLRISKNPSVSDLKNIIIVWRFCRRMKVDILHGHSAKGGMYARIAGFLIAKPVIYTPHGGSVHSRFGKLKIQIYAFVEYALKFLTTLFVFESQYTRESFLKLAGKIPNNRQLVNYNGVHIDRLIPLLDWKPKSNREVCLLIVGILSLVKGQDIAIHAVSILKKRGWKVSLDLCGDGKERAYMESLAAKLKLNNFIRFHGDVADVRPYYEACDIVVIPSRFESFSYVAVEAALMRRPIVASATGGLIETVINEVTGLSFFKESPEALVDKIERTISDKEATRQRIEAARVRALELFDVNRMTAQIYSIYRQLTS